MHKVIQPWGPDKLRQARSVPKRRRLDCSAITIAQRDP